jgi:ApaG protein
MSTTPLHRVAVKVRTNYLEEQSSPEQGRYVFSYTVTLENQGSSTAKLLSRHWIITDGDGKKQEVRGAGVVGEQPLLDPGDQFEYTSGTLLATPVGAMHGSYEMIADDGTHFDAEIPSFTLAVPRTLH